MLDMLDAAAVRRWCTAGLAALSRSEHEINQLNVYPVPDGDTGTNLVLTLTAADQALGQEAAAGGPVGAALRTMARGALLGARGNSGVIVAQLLRGLADSLTGRTVAGGPELATGLAAAARASYAAVAEPVEGTILSVASAAARAAGRVTGTDLSAVVRAAAGAAATALARTPQQLPVLAAAGVVDAGGRGLVVLLDTLLEVVDGTRSEAAGAVPAGTGAAGTGVARTGGARTGGAGAGRGEAAVGPGAPVDHPAAGGAGAGAGYGYEVQYLLVAEDPAVARLRTVLGGLGDSLVVVGTGEGTWNVHVHVDDVGAAIEAGVVAGRPYQITVTRFEDQTAAPIPGARGAVVVASGGGLVDLFTAEGAVVVGGTPSTVEVVSAIRATRAGQVVLLPNDPDTQAVATFAADEAATDDIRVAVVPTRSPVQALAALAVRDPQRRFDDDVIAMAEAAGNCRYAEVCRAARDALTVAGRCRAGDVLGLVEGEVHLIGADLATVGRQLLDRLLGGGGELVSLLVGADAPAGYGDVLSAHLAEVWPFVEVQLLHGGQPHYPLVVGVE